VTDRPPHESSANYNESLGSPRTILAVDDDQAVVDLMSTALRAADYRVLTAAGGREAIEVFENSGGRVDLLVTDVIMPHLTGPVLAERLRARQPDLPVLFVSGFHDADLVHRFVIQKGYSLLPKPFRVEALLRVVSEQLDSSPW
jgi:two-component system, cell cycle sensor histidine kinase and response regulator CckA